MDDAVIGLLIPLAGTTVGAAFVFGLRSHDKIDPRLEQMLSGFAAGVMTAASVWSLLIPAISRAEARLGRLAFLPAAAGFAVGIAFLMLIDAFTARSTAKKPDNCGERCMKRRNAMLCFAVTLHNLPEGMAVGAVYAGLRYGVEGITAASALALAVGIAVQNLPEGAIISMPLRSGGMKRHKAFAVGALSGVVEPLGGALTLAASGLIVPALPFMLSFAAGAMIYVVVQELVPQMSSDKHRYCGTLFYAAGFLFMMTLDVALG